MYLRLTWLMHAKKTKSENTEALRQKGVHKSIIFQCTYTYINHENWRFLFIDLKIALLKFDSHPAPRNQKSTSIIDFKDKNYHFIVKIILFDSQTLNYLRYAFDGSKSVPMWLIYSRKGPSCMVLSILPQFCNKNPTKQKLFDFAQKIAESVAIY